MTDHTLPGQPVQDTLDLDTLDTSSAFPAPVDRSRTLIPRSRAPRDDVDTICDRLWAAEDLDDARRAIILAIVLDARANAGIVDPNHVRQALAGGHDRPQVKAQLIGAVYRRLVHAGLLERHAWVESTDHASGNAGKPARTYRLARVTPAAQPETATR